MTNITKFVNRTLSLSMASVFAAGVCIPAYATGTGIETRESVQVPGGAEDSSASSLTVETPAEGHQYKAYQVFKGKVSSDGTKLSNVQYGANYSGREGMTLDEELAELEAEGADAKAFAEAVRDLLTGDPAAVLTKESPAAELEAGYYIIIDESLYEGNGDSLSDYIVAVAGNVTVQPKSTGVPGFDKSIDDETPPVDAPEDIDLSPETGDADWNYTLNEDTGVITLNYYIGTNPDVKVYSHYRISGDDRVWKAELKSSNGLSDRGTYMFSNRKDINSVIFSDKLDTSTCLSMSCMFYNCKGLKSIDFGTNFNTENVTNMSYMFYGAWMTELDISRFSTAEVTNMQSMFANASYMESLIFDLGLFDTAKVTNMNSMFFGCGFLKAVDVSRFNTQNCTDMSYMFSGCMGIEVLDVSRFMTDKVTRMNHMFDNMQKVKILDCSSFNTEKVTNMSGMFSSCLALETLDLSNFNTSNVTDMNRMFTTGIATNGYEYTQLRSINVSGFDTSKVVDMEEMFGDLSLLETLDLSSFNTENVTNMKSMFEGCKSLPSIDLSGFNVSNVTDMTQMFTGCTAATEINVSSFRTNSLTAMDHMFSSCAGIQELHLEGFDLSNIEVGLDYQQSNVFTNCTNLQKIYVVSDRWNEYKIASNSCDGTKLEKYNYYTYVDDPFAAAFAAPVFQVFKKIPSIAGIFSKASASELNTDADADTNTDTYTKTEQQDVVPSSDAIEIEDDDTSVSYGIGDSIPYKLTATMPESITAYKKYQLVFHDRLSAGLDYNRDSLKVFAGGTEIPAENYTVAYSEDRKSLTVSINDVKAAPWNAVSGTEIVVKYSAVLNENAEVKNRNEAWLEYSNDPKGDGTGETGPGVPDTVDVYTFEIRFDKVDKNGDPLAGAGFTLYKKDDAGEFQPFGEEVKGVTRFSFKRLSAGEYKLVETTTPDGYNTMEDFVFRIDAETADGTDGKIKRITMVPVSGGAGAWTAVAADMAFESDIANYTGSTLPSTGGIGTYAFYLAGAAVVITVGTVMAAKKKEDKE